jgi:hypothetical protein
MSQPHLLKAIFITAGVPATNDASGFEALVWTRVAHPIVGPSFGTTNNNIDIPNLETGFTQGGKGAQTGNESAMEFGKVASDAGQTLLKQLAEAGGVNGNGSIKLARITTAGGTPAPGAAVEYATGYFGGYSEGAADTASYESVNVTFKQNAPAVNAVEPTP